MFVFLHLAVFVSAVAAVWPVPSSYSSGENVLWIERGVKFSFNGVPQVSSSLPLVRSLVHVLNSLFIQPGGYGQKGVASSSVSDKVVSTAIDRTIETIFDQNFVPWKFHPRFSDFEPSSNATKTYIKSISLQQNGTESANVTKPLSGAIDESYALSVTDNGEVTITALSSVGLAHGLTTFTQLFYKHTNGQFYTPLAPVEITDAPKFEHRGLNMDVARNYYAPSDILRTIDALAYNKFNRLHIHITDSQSWPLEIPSLPLLAEKGAYGKGLSYSPATLASIQEYGALRGVETILEIDMPGHTSSIAYGYPDLVAAFNLQPDWDLYAAEPPSGTLKLNSSAVDSFVKTLFDDMLPRVLPYSAYFHTGGDEVNADAYTLDDTVRTNDTAVLKPLMQAFVDKNHAHVRAAGLTPIVWEEMLLTWNLTLGSDVVVQSWLSDESVASITTKGHKVLAGNYNYWVSFLFSSRRTTCPCMLTNTPSTSTAAKANG